MFEPSPAEASCPCCDRSFSAYDRAVCSFCGRPFHLAMRLDVPVDECGQVWINDEAEALEFGCNDCLRRLGRLAAAEVKRRYTRIDADAAQRKRRRAPRVLRRRRDAL